MFQRDKKGTKAAIGQILVQGTVHLAGQFPPSGALPHPEIKPASLALQEDSLPTESSGKPFYYPYFFANTFEYFYFYLTCNKLCRIRTVFIVLLHPSQILT